jgi:hypothetical protein
MCGMTTNIPTPRRMSRMGTHIPTIISGERRRVLREYVELLSIDEGSRGLLNILFFNLFSLLSQAWGGFFSFSPLFHCPGVRTL